MVILLFFTGRSRPLCLRAFVLNKVAFFLELILFRPDQLRPKASFLPTSSNVSTVLYFHALPLIATVMRRRGAFTRTPVITAFMMGKYS